MKLWFAFNFGYLWHRYHLRNCASLVRQSCDLLSILGIFDIAITKTTFNTQITTVVICFQFWVSLTSLSLECWSCSFPYSLWFAFNFGYLWHRYHSMLNESLGLVGCDLLSILGIFDIAITVTLIDQIRHLVVICFQFWVSLTSLSLLIQRKRRGMRLWFAFNFGYLWHRYHWHDRDKRHDFRCDLLSILGIFDIAITSGAILHRTAGVVICFQFWVSLTSLSLGIPYYCRIVLLWFAFNFGYLWHRYH